MHRDGAARGRWCVLAAAVVALANGAQAQGVPPAPTLALEGGHWLGPAGFRSATRYVVAGRLTAERPVRVDSVLDLRGGFVVPAFGEAHNHNIESLAPRLDSVIAAYLRAGVFLVRNPGIVPRMRAPLAGRVNVPGSVDAAFANGLLTSSTGHPMGLFRRNLARGVFTAADGDGAFVWLLDSLPDLDRAWPAIVAGRPDFIKTVLAYSEEFARRRADTAAFGWTGLDPALLPPIVQRAHAAGLRVATHVETAADFRAAVAAGVDEINHMPGFRGNERGQLPDDAPYRLTARDAREAAARGVVIVTTLSGAARAAPAERAAFDSLHARNLRVLRAAGARIAIGTDRYFGTPVEEMQYLIALGVFAPLELVRMWSEVTPRAVFPARRVGCLEEGCEASVVVLARDPSLDATALFEITGRIKDGRPLP